MPILGESLLVDRQRQRFLLPFQGLASEYSLIDRPSTSETKGERLTLDQLKELLLRPRALTGCEASLMAEPAANA